MARIAANLTYLFTDLPMLQRFAAARRAGFDGVEILFPYDLVVKDLVRAATAEGLEFVLMNAPPPNWAGGQRGFAATPGHEARFRSDFDRALRFALALKVQHLHVLAGRAQGAAAYKTLVDNLKWATARAPQVSLTIGAGSSRDHPGCILDDLELAAEIATEIGAPNLGLQFDACQIQITHGQIAPLWQRLAPLTRHIRIRTAPAGTHFNLSGFLRLLEASGYDGWIGADCMTAAPASARALHLRSA